MLKPSDQYLLGTDQLGRDLLSRLIVGARISLTVGLVATALNVLMAILIGSLSGFLGGCPRIAFLSFGVLVTH
jgi:ABC-type dipeptide/oligopeptide/nickel transport system permease subunit